MEIIETIVNAVTLFSDAIQWVFSFVNVLFTSLLSIYDFVTTGLQRCYDLIHLLPSWLIFLPIAFIAYCLAMFLIHLGGNS